MKFAAQKVSPSTLEQFAILKGLGTECLLWISSRLEPLSSQGQQSLTQEGSANDQLFFIAQGNLCVRMAVAPGTQQTVASLRAPTVVGEMSCLLRRAAIASVVSSGPVVGWSLDATGLHTAPPQFHIRERLLERVLKLVACRLETTNKSVLDFMKAQREQESFSLGEIEQFTDTWNAGFSLQDSFEELDEAWKFVSLES